MVSDGAVTNIHETSNEHIHDEVSNWQLTKDKIRNTCKWKAAKNISYKSSKIMRSALSAIKNTEEHDVPSVRQSMYEEKQKCIPKVSVSGGGIIQISNSAIKTSRGENFAFVENNIIF